MQPAWGHHIPLRLGTNVWPGYEPLYLAQDLNLLDPKEVTLVEFLSASEVLRAMRNGAIDAAALTMDEVLLLLAKGMDLKIFLTTDMSRGGDAIIVNAKFTQ